MNNTQSVRIRKNELNRTIFMILGRDDWNSDYLGLA